MGHSLKFHKLAGTIGKPEEGEVKIAMSFRANESIVASLNSIAMVTRVSKNEILNQVLEIALTEFCEALESRTDFCSEIRNDPYQVFEFFTPAQARSARARFGEKLDSAFQLDLQDAIEEEEKKPKPPTKGK